MNNKHKKIIKAVACGVIAVGVFFLGFFSYAAFLSENQRAVLSIVKNYEEHYYFEEDNLPQRVADAILDQYSAYYSKEEYQAVKQKAVGLNVGVGLSFESGTVNVANVIVNSPADKSGVKAGGKVVSVTAGGTKTAVSTFEEFSAVMDGLSKGEGLVLEMDYNGEIISYTTKKDEYRRTYVSYADINGYYTFSDDGGNMQLVKRSDANGLNSGVSYIKYDLFSGKESGLNGSVGQLTAALNKAKENGNKKIILDLRNNGGGSMEILREVAKLLVEPNGNNNQVFSIAKDKYGVEEKFTFSGSLFNNYGYEKIIVLANQNTASASEALIGAMLDYDTKGIVTVVLDGHVSGGETVYKTYGKGIMQTTYLNADGSAVKLTTALLTLPVSKISIHGTGFTAATSSKVVNATNGNALTLALELLK